LSALVLVMAFQQIYRNPPSGGHLRFVGWEQVRGFPSSRAQNAPRQALLPPQAAGQGRPSALRPGRTGSVAPQAVGASLVGARPWGRIGPGWAQARPFLYTPHQTISLPRRAERLDPRSRSHSFPLRLGYPETIEGVAMVCWKLRDRKRMILRKSYFTRDDACLLCSPVEIQRKRRLFGQLGPHLMA
jgi:hypothetical protein